MDEALLMSGGLIEGWQEALGYYMMHLKAVVMQ